MSAGFIDVLILVGIFSLVTLGLDFIVGYSKIFSTNQAFMMAIGAFSYVFTYQEFGSASILLSWTIAIVVSCILSAIISLASLRVRGDAFIVVSFGAQIVGIQAIFNMTPISGGASGVIGLPTPSVFGWVPQSQIDYLILVLAIAVIVYAVTSLIVFAPWGRVLRAVGEDDIAVAAGGFDPRRLKVVAFMLGGTYAAIAGTLYVGYLGMAQVGDYSLSISMSLLAMVVLGGAGRLLGGLMGAIVYVTVPYLLDYTGLSSATAAFVKQGIFGLALLAVVFFAPSGISGAFTGLIRRARDTRSVDGFADRHGGANSRKGLGQ